VDHAFLNSVAYNSARAALKNYRRARKKLMKLGIIRSERTVQGDYGEWLACSLLKLTTAKSGVQPGYDATDEQGQKYQIKTRLIHDIDSATSFDLHEMNQGFDFLLGVLLSKEVELLAIVKIPYAEVSSRANKNLTSYRLRWTKANWKASWVEVLYKVSNV